MKERKNYITPSMDVVEIECESALLAMSGYGYDSDDSEFGSRNAWRTF